MSDLSIPVSVEGSVKIIDLDSGCVLRSGKNAIHQENMSQAIALALSGGDIISEIHFGNGASITDGSGAITFRPPNIVGYDADLYTPIYYRVVDALDFENGAPNDNKTTVEHIRGNTYSDIIVTTTLNYQDPTNAERNGGFVKSLSTAPLDQQATDGAMRFDEIGLKNRSSAGLDQGLLLTHFRFHPVQKNADQRIQIIYTLRLRTGNAAISSTVEILGPTGPVGATGPTGSAGPTGPGGETYTEFGLDGGEAETTYATGPNLDLGAAE